MIVIIYDNNNRAIPPYSNRANNSLEQKERYDIITDEEWCILAKV